MRSTKFRFGRLALGLAIVLGTLGFAGSAFAQAVTTGGIVGDATTASDSSKVPGVAIEAIHTPTGTRYTAMTGANGRYSLLGVKVGGPYTVTAKLEGFQPVEVGGVNVGLGDSVTVNFTLQLAAVTEQIEIVAEADPLISADRMGSSSAVSTEQLESLPTIRRQIQDFARLNPYFTADASNPDATRISVAGKNNRYNNIQIDGAVNNDLFGLADTGTPGGQADTQPIALDAIQEIKLVVSPYDVRQGGFTGGGINAITRSGSNAFSGSVYGSTRDPDYVGDGPFNRPIADFNEDQYGFRLGGPILRDRLFFFASAERNEREAPTGISADGSTGQQYNNPANAARFRNDLITRYGYDPGDLGDFPIVKDSDLAFLRFDLSASASHQVTLRHNYISASSDVVADRSTSRFRFPTAIYALADETNSTVLQANSVFGSSSFNEARIGYQTIRDVRTTPVIFPTVDIGPIARSPEMSAGTERFSGANSLDQDVLEITDDFTKIFGDHTITVGTHNELFKFTNLFLSDFYGWYRFNSLTDFEKGIAQEFSIGFANGADPRRPAEFSVNQWGLYAGDQWRVNDKLTFVLGLRADFPDLVDNPSYNPAIEAAFGVDNSEVPANKMISPRLGFNWDPAGDGKQQLRGGVGVFAGRTPYVWISNAYANTGIESTSLAIKGAIPFNPDPNNQPHNLGAAAGITVDLVDPDFKAPQVLRGTLAYDRELFWGIRASVETMYTETQQDVYYLNLNKTATGKFAFDGRPTYAKKSTKFNDALYLTNTSQGKQLNGAVTLQKRWQGLFVSAMYAYQDAQSAFDGTSSRAISNWQFHPTRGSITEPELSRSSFEVENRITLTASYNFKLGPVGNTVAFYYNGQSGYPYSILMAGDPNGDGFSTNDLMYVPANASEVILKGTTWEQFDAFMTSIGAKRGAIQKRNSFTAPWNKSFDFHYGIDLPIKMIRTQVNFDILNLFNLIDSEKGAVEFVSNGTYTPITYSGIDAATGKPIYTMSTSSPLVPGRQFSTSDIRSRWQAKLGLRLSF